MHTDTSCSNMRRRALCCCKKPPLLPQGITRHVLADHPVATRAFVPFCCCRKLSMQRSRARDSLHTSPFGTRIDSRTDCEERRPGKGPRPRARGPCPNGATHMSAVLLHCSLVMYVALVRETSPASQQDRPLLLSCTSSLAFRTVFITLTTC